MTTLSDLPLSQITRAYGAVAKIKVHPRRFSCKSSAISHLEQLLAEKGLTTADALRAAGIECADSAAELEAAPVNANVESAAPTPAPSRFLALNDIEADEDGCELEQVEDGDIPGTEDPPEPGMIWNEPEQTWEYPEQDLSEALDAAAPVASQADPEPTAPSSPVEDHPAQKPPRARGRANIPAVFLHPEFRTELCERARDWLIEQGCSQQTAIEAAEWLENAMTAPPSPEPAAPRQPRVGTKQEILIALLRRPEGATIAQMIEATGWLSHTCRGALAGALKKKLGLVITSAKDTGGERVYKVA